MANMMVRNRGQREADLPRTRPRSIMETLFRSPLAELSMARDLMDVVSEATAFVPNVQVSEKDGNYRIDVALPGFRREDIDIEVSGNEVTVWGKYEQKKEDRKTHYSEMRQASFTRTITLPAEINADKVTATFDNGVLHITAPPSAPISAKKVQIKAGNQ